MNDDHLDIPKTDETQQPTPEENYFSRSKNQWLLVSDMSDMHVRRAFKRLLRMIRLGQLIELEDKPIFINNQEQIKEQVKSIRTHCYRIEDILNDN